MLLVPGAARAAGNRWGPPRRGCGPVGMRRMIGAPISAPSGTDAVSTAPAAVLIAIWLVVACVVAHSHAAVDTDAGHLTGVQQGQCQGTHSHRHPFATEVHFGSTLLSLPVHSINPNGAPAGSATTATWPPWRSTCGSTSTRPPEATTFATMSTVWSTLIKLSQCACRRAESPGNPFALARA